MSLDQRVRRAIVRLRRKGLEYQDIAGALGINRTAVWPDMDGALPRRTRLHAQKRNSWRNSAGWTSSTCAASAVATKGARREVSNRHIPYNPCEPDVTEGDALGGKSQGAVLHAAPWYGASITAAFG
jgi:hypothetical protein